MSWLRNRQWIILLTEIDWLAWHGKIFKDSDMLYSCDEISWNDAQKIWDVVVIMAVICKCPSGFVVDHNQAVYQSLSSCPSTTSIDGSTSNLKLKKELFYIHEPYIMDSQYEAAQSYKVKDGESSRKRKV